MIFVRAEEPPGIFSLPDVPVRRTWEQTPAYIARAQKPDAAGATPEVFERGIIVIRRCIFLLCWALSLWGTLKLASASSLMGHDICGPWGCGPPASALLACHLGWLVFLSPLLLFARHVAITHPKQVHTTGYLVALSGGIGILAVGVHQYLTWLPMASEFARGYLWHRWAFVIATLTDVPIVQAILLGLAVAWIASSGTLREGGDVHLTESS